MKGKIHTKLDRASKFTLKENYTLITIFFISPFIGLE